LEFSPAFLDELDIACQKIGHNKLLEELSENLIRKALFELEGNICLAATALSLKRTTLWMKLARLKIDVEEYRSDELREKAERARRARVTKGGGTAC